MMNDVRPHYSHADGNKVSPTPESSEDTSQEMHFDVHPSVLFKLGEDLISDDAQALAELIKNSYDADATAVRVIVDTQHWYSLVTGERVDQGDDEQAVLGRIQVTDNGTGMTVDAIRRGWLTVSYSQKRAMKAEGGRTRGMRVPLGDKGLGRLGVQRLGRAVLLDTVPATRFEAQNEKSSVQLAYGSERAHLMIDWDRFGEAESLGSVTLTVASEPVDERPAGTSISVLGLSNRGYWTDGSAVDLQRELTSVISPYDRASGLGVTVTLNGRGVDLRQEARKLLNAAPWQMSFSFEQGRLLVTSRMSHQVLRGKGRERRVYRDLITNDGGYAFAQHLLEAKKKKAAERGMAHGDDQHFLTFRYSVDLADTVPSHVTFADPGDFLGEISSYALERESITGDEAPDDDALGFESRTEFAEYAEALSGIRVFRDGFGIRLPKDWLALSDQQTTGSSWYGLRPRNTAGYVNLTVEHNSGLLETSNREAFQDTPAWRGFYALMRDVTAEARRCLDLVRREWNEYRRESLNPTVLPGSASPAEIVEHIEERIVEAQHSSRAAETARATVEKLADSVEKLVSSSKSSESAVWSDPELARSVAQAAVEVEASRLALEGSLQELDKAWLALREVSGSAALLQEKLAVADRRITEAWEAVALGLSAELLAHEVDNIGERLRGRSYQITEYLRAQDPRDARVLGFADHVRASASELLRQSARLNPALRFRRDRKTVAALGDLLTPLIEYHRTRLETADIQLEVVIHQDFRVKINEGKLSQIVDNLILNSEYWVRRSLAQNLIERGRITLTIDTPRLTITDNGPGVSPTVQDSLFEAFVTAKPERHGRGLGLFVVRQLVESEGGEISLLEEASGVELPRTFEVDLRQSRTTDALGEVTE